jgi:hypothetical protein
LSIASGALPVGQPAGVHVTQSHKLTYWRRRNAVWLNPLARAAGSYLAAGVLGGWVSHWSRSPLRTLVGLGLIALIVYFVMQLVSAIRSGYRLWRLRQQQHGHFTRGERARRDRRLAEAEQWELARHLMATLSSGPILQSDIKIWGVILEPGEVLLVDTTAEYARYYGLEPTYVHTNGVFMGSASFVVAGYGLIAWANHRRRKAARAAAETSWREHQQVRLLITDRRLLCQVSGGRWLSFYYSAATAMYPEPGAWTVVLDFHEAVPLRIAGVGAPCTAVVATWALHGSTGVREHPALAPLRES